MSSPRTDEQRWSAGKHVSGQRHAYPLSVKAWHAARLAISFVKTHKVSFLGLLHYRLRFFVNPQHLASLSAVLAKRFRPALVLVHPRDRLVVPAAGKVLVAQPPVTRCLPDVRYRMANSQRWFVPSVAGRNDIGTTIGVVAILHGETVSMFRPLAHWRGGCPDGGANGCSSKMSWRSGRRLLQTNDAALADLPVGFASRRAALERD